MSSSLVFSPLRPGPRHSLAQRSVVACGVVALHAALAWGVWHSAPLTLSAPPATPVMLQWVNTVAEPAPTLTPPPPTPPQPSSPPKTTTAPPRTAAPRVTQAPSVTPAPASPAAPEAAAEPAPVDKPSTEGTQATSTLEPPSAGAPSGPATHAAPAPAPVIPAQAVQYLIAPQLRYPSLSKRMGEAGQVLVRVWVNEAGLPQQVQVRQSSGFARLDEAAVAAVQGARFKPYLDNGRPTAGWAFIPLVFDLDSN